MNLSQLYYFKSLVQEGSYSAAADKLFVAQSTLSLSVSNLEKELGVRLLCKKRNGIELTEEGKEFYVASMTATNALDSCVASIKEDGSLENSTIRIGAVYSVQSEAWSNMLRAYRRKTGGKVHLEIVQGTTESLLSSLKAGEIDLAFMGMLAKPDPAISAMPCFTQSVALVVNKENPLSARRSVSLDELISRKVISYRRDSGPFESELGNLLAKSPKVTIAGEYSDEISLCSMVVADPETVAIACHSWLVDSFAGLNTLRIREAPEDFHQFYLCHRKHGRQRLCVESFLTLARSIEFANVTPVKVDLEELELSEELLLN